MDLRDRTAYTAEHVAGTIGIALGDQFATYLCWLIPWGSPLPLIGQSQQQIAAAQRQLIRIGIERLAGAAVGTAAELAGEDELRGYPRMSFGDLPAHLSAGNAAEAVLRGDVLLDVRRDDERASGFRASIAASLLDRAGLDVVFIDDDFANAVSSGLATG